MKANAAMTRNVICIEPGDTLADAHQLMTEWEIRHLPVMEDDRLVGILSDRDLLVYATPGQDGLEFPNLTVSEAMTPRPITCFANADICAIGRTMTEHKIDCVPVVDHDTNLVGLITSTDLIELLIDQGSSASTRPSPFAFRVVRSARPAATFSSFNS